MKYLKIIFAFFLLIFQTSCQKEIVGTWYKCNKDGSYYEYKITDQYTIMLSSKSDIIWIHKVKQIDNGIILSDFDSSVNRLMINNDTLIVLSKTKDRIVLKSSYTWDKMELNKAEFDFDKIDSTNLDSWKKKTISEFKKRAELKNCPDLRTEEEKNIPTINLDDFEEEEITIEIKEK
ncbi:hypothetical protein CJ739_2858 [Mariniflexile rhizosphaerae]|uniref:hypothetical protein n=1 Tax=unclassified Mariniflexile TaxID=2643887 RepID=UPI000E337B30|nr:hypothetical protein [Mariniflexile sp. TRM1-10]AXP81923.1 hypothetical protein CJ739_2858 [Mariniflexile sp. TRM1-10]